MSRKRLEDELKGRLRTRKLERVEGSARSSCISSGFCYSIDNDESIFIKTNASLNARVMFDGELESLRHIEATRTIRVPKPLLVIHNFDATNQAASAIAIEWLNIRPLAEEGAKSLGRNLANLHDYNSKVLRFNKRAKRWIGGKPPSAKAVKQVKSRASLAWRNIDDDSCHGSEEDETDEEEENQFTKHHLRIKGSNLTSTSSYSATTSLSVLSSSAAEVEAASKRLQQQQLDPPKAEQRQQEPKIEYPSKFVPEPDTEEITQFGFNIPTSCGSIPQINEWHDDWVSFYARHRLEKAIRELLAEHGDRELHQQWSHLQLKVDKFFSDFDQRGSNDDDNNTGGSNKIVPALLHGDLWSGNVAQLSDGSQGVTYDPASFYGHSEYDFGIARMFGGFPRAFEEAYFEIKPKKKLFEKRNKLYQFFHHLNHWEHFGSGYRASSLRLIKELNALV